MVPAWPGVRSFSAGESTMRFQFLFAILVAASANLAAQPDGAKKDLEMPARALVDLLAKEDYAGAVKNFDATMKKVLPADKLKETWQGILESTGPFKKQG